MTYRSSILFFVTGVALCLPAWSQAPVGELSAADASVKGAVVMSTGGTGVGSGSVISAGESTASLRLARGGEVRICPHSSLSVTASPAGNQLMLALGSGAIEVDYRLGSSSDTILTPDFRILLDGPGEFHSAIASDPRGNTCIRSLQSDTASIIVNELLGDGVYQVRPGGQVLFHGGSVKGAESVAPPDCACPLPPASPLNSEGGIISSNPPDAAAHPETAPLPEASPGEVHVSVDAPLVFRATDSPLSPPPIVARLRLETFPPLLTALPVVEPPSPALQSESNSEPKKSSSSGPTRRFFGHIGSWFASWFHRNGQ